jgi:hypothetical protein
VFLAMAMRLCTMSFYNMKSRFGSVVIITAVLCMPTTLCLQDKELDKKAKKQKK